MIPLTPHALLRPLQLSDAAALFDVIETNRSLLEQYLYWTASVTSVEDTYRYIDERIHSKANGAFWYAIVFQTRIAGVLGVKAIDVAKSEVEMGYWLGAQAQGQGLVTRAVLAVANRIFNEQQIKTLVLHCLAENQASQRVAQRLGGRWVEVVKGFYELDGSVQDLQIAHVTLPITLSTKPPT